MPWLAVIAHSILRVARDPQRSEGRLLIFTDTASPLADQQLP